MSTVLDRAALQGSPLADLHVIANELGVDGFRRLRKVDLIDAIVARQSGGEAPAAAESGATDTQTASPSGTGESDAEPKRRSRRSRSRRSASDRDEETTAAVEAADRADADTDEDPEAESTGRGRGRRRGGRGGRSGPGDADEAPKADTDELVQGTIDLQPNGSGFVRVAEGGDPSDGDVYVSAAQVKRCELVTGDRVGGPVRGPRRSERHPSLIRVDTINGRPADEVAEGTRFDDLPAAFPTERLELGSDDATVGAVQWLTPFGRGSRVVVCGPALSGKSDLLRRIAGALAGREGLELSVVLAGARPEELGEWADAVAPTAVAPLGAAPEQLGLAVEQAVEQGRRVAARGGDAVVVIDSLDGVGPGAARRALAAARNIRDGGSLTVIATAAAPLGGETTVIALDAALTGLRRFPNLDLSASATMRPELLVGQEGASKLAQARAEAAA